MTQAVDEARVRSLLVGLLPADEAERVEDAVFSDDERLSLLEVVESDLLDDWARGALTGAEGARFEAAMMRSERGRARLAMARALVAHGRQRHALAPRRAAARVRFRAWSVGGVLAVAAAVTLLIARRPAAPSDADARAALVVIAIEADGMRGGPGDRHEVTLNGRGPTRVRFEIAHSGAPRDAVFSIVVRDAAGKVWTSPATAAAGTVVSAEMDATGFHGGIYDVALRAGDEDVARFALRVRTP